MRWFSLLTGRKTKAYKKVLKVEEKRHICERAALHGATELEAEGYARADW